MCAISSKLHRDTNRETPTYFPEKMEEIMEGDNVPAPEEEFNLDFDMGEEVPVHEKCPDMMPMLELPKMSTKRAAMEMPPLEAVAIAARCHEPDDKNESSGDEQAPPRRSGRIAVVAKNAVVTNKRG
jgi:hypothetical protein